MATARHAVIRNGAEHVVDDLPEEIAAAVGRSPKAGHRCRLRGRRFGSALLQALPTATLQACSRWSACARRSSASNPTPMVFAENTAFACIAYRPDDFRAAHRATAGAPSYRRVP